VSYELVLEADARLVILTELARQTDGRLNDTVLAAALDARGFRRSREWVRTQIAKLAELGALAATPAGSVVVAALTRAGRDHVERRSRIEGVARPQDD
jgi:hypothetical protein